MNKKRRPSGLFWCPELERLNCLLLNLAVCYFGLYNYLQIQIDTTKTGKMSERWPKGGQGITILILHNTRLSYQNLDALSNPPSQE